MAQCVRGSRVVCFDRMRRRMLDEPAVVARVRRPARVDPGLARPRRRRRGRHPGVPRWGGKSASACWPATGTSRRSRTRKPSGVVAVRGAAALAESLREHRKEASLYRRLATLRTDVPLAEGIEDLRWRGALRPELTSLCREIGEEHCSSECRPGANRGTTQRQQHGQPGRIVSPPASLHHHLSTTISPPPSLHQRLSTSAQRPAAHQLRPFGLEPAP